MKKLNTLLLVIIVLFLIVPVLKVSANGSFSTNNLVANTQSNKSVKLTWSETANAEGYIIYRRIGNGNFEYLYMTTTPYYVDNSAQINEYNFYRVYPYINTSSGREIGSSTNYVYAKPTVGTTLNLKAKATGNREITLDWDKTANVTGYIIYKKVDSGKFEYLTLTTSNYYIDKSATQDVFNFYRIYPYYTKNGVRHLGYSGNYAYAKPVFTVNKASNLKATANANRQITLTWSKATDVDGYIIYRKRSDEKNFSYAYMTSSSSWVNSNLKPDVFYFYRVYSYKNIDGKRVLSSSTDYVYAKPSSSQKLEGLELIDGEYYYYLSNGTLRKGFNVWPDIGKAYFDETTGEMQLGIVKVPDNGYTYCFKKGGGVYTGFYEENQKKYHFNTSTGVMTKGYVYIGGIPYFFDLDSGEMLTGKKSVQLSTGNFTFYFLEGGGIYKGLRAIDSELYYFNVGSGEMVTNHMMVIDNKKYYFSEQGNALTGVMRNAKTGYSYYFDTELKAGVRTGAQIYEGNSYLFHDESGIMKVGLWSIQDALYFFDRTTGKMEKSTSFTDISTGIDFRANGLGELSWTANSSYQNDERTQVILSALDKIGAPYTTDSSGFVCSSLVAYAYDQVGYDKLLGLESDEQAQFCLEKGQVYNAKTNNIDDVIQPGDLIFWRDNACGDSNCNHWNEIHHVGIYLGNNQVVEASERMGYTLVRDIAEDSDFEIMYYADIISY